MPGVKRYRTALESFMAGQKTRRIARRRRVTARTRVRRGMKFRQINQHSFRRYANDARDSVTGTTFSNALTFQFSDVRGAADFEGLYDRFMIKKVELRFRLVNNPDSATKLNDSSNFVSSNWFPTMYYCRDYDDAAAETREQLQERAGTKRVILHPNKWYKITVKPAVTMLAYRTALGTDAYSPKWNQWIDMGQPNTQHYGFKYCIDLSAQDPGDAQPYLVERETVYHFQCKDVR